MSRSWYFRLTLVLGSLLVALYLLYPSYVFYFRATDAERQDQAKFCKSLPSWLMCTKFNLGLDLQGGVHLVMGVRVEKAVEHRADRLSEAVRDGLKEAAGKDPKLAFERIDRPRGTADIVLTLASGAEMGAVEKYLRKEFRSVKVGRREGNVLRLELDEQEANYVRESAVEQAIKTIRNRADKLGVTEPTIAKRGTDSVLIQLPGVKEPERAIDVIGRTAQLEFRMVDDEGTSVFDSISADKLPEGVKKEQETLQGPGGKSIREVFFDLLPDKKDALLALLDPVIPDDREIAFGGAQFEPGVENPTRLRTYLIHARAAITGDYLTDARAQQDPELPSNYFVIMTFDPKGAQLFARLTEENVRRRMAIVLDGVVNSAPVIHEKIPGGTARITLGGAGDAQRKFEEAKALSLVLKAGALPAPVEVREKRQVGRSLGQDAVRQGSIAFTVGALLVLLFMAIYYKWSGVLADVAVVLNVLLVLSVMALFGATLTLPGMAGVVLTMGMAVDANVIIHERMREELRLGKTPRAAIEAGYGKAFWTIFDSNVTTIIAGVVLMQYGTGPVRGFAVTLIVGILASMFTAIVVTRLIYDLFTGTRRLRTLSV